MKKKIFPVIIAVLFAVILVNFYSIEPKEKNIKANKLILEMEAEDVYESYSTVLSKEFQNIQWMWFWTDCQKAEVLVDGTVVYTNDTEDNHFGKEIDLQWNYVQMPEESEGKELEIRLSAPYERCRSKQLTVMYGNVVSMIDYLFFRYIPNLLMDVFLVLIGTFFVAFSFFNKYGRMQRIRSRCYGITAVLFAIWFHFHMKGMTLLIVSASLKELIGYFAFLVLPIPLTYCMKEQVKECRRYATFFKVLLVLQTLLSVGLFLLHGLEIRDIQENIIIAQGLLLVEASSILVYAVLSYIQMRSKGVQYFIINAVLFLLSAITSILYGSGMIESVRMDIFMRVCLLGISILELGCFVLMTSKQEAEKKKLEVQNKNLQLQVLTGQIRPHFILNTLGAIRTMIGRDPDRASDLLYDFSKYIRKNMEQKDYSKLIPFMEELDYIETYLKLESIRFEGKLHVEYDIQETKFWVLPLTLQPFVENAVKHGVLPLKQGGTLWISSRKTKSGVEVEIKDNGVGFDTRKFWSELDNTKSVGMKSAIYRLESEMGAACKIKSSQKSGESGTCILIQIPERK